MQTRRWRKEGEDTDRFSTEIIVVPGHRVQFYDKPNGNGAQAAGRSRPSMDGTGAAPGSPRSHRHLRRGAVLGGFPLILPPSRLGGRRFGVGPPFCSRTGVLSPMSCPTRGTRGGEERRVGRFHCPGRESMTRDTVSVFARGAVIVPDFVTPAEEERLLLRISAQAPWMTELQPPRATLRLPLQTTRGASRPVPAAPFPRWAEVMADRLRPHFRRRAAGAVHRERVPPRPGHRHARRPQRFRRRSWPRSRSAPTGRCASARVRSGPTPATASRATRWRCCPAARSWSSRARHAGTSCTVSTAPTPPREAAIRISATFRTLASGAGQP